MTEVKKRKGVYNENSRKSDIKYLSTLTPEKKAEKNRRKAFSAAFNFILKKRYTDEEFNELYNLISERKKTLDEN